MAACWRGWQSARAEICTIGIAQSNRVHGIDEYAKISVQPQTHRKPVTEFYSKLPCLICIGHASRKARA